MKVAFWLVLLAGAVAFNPFQTRSSDVLEANVTCPQYQCHPASMNFTRGTCAFTQNNTNYLQRCYHLGNQTDCVYNVTSHNSTCVAPQKPSPVALTSYPGERCTQQSDCVYGSCASGKCKGVLAQGACSSHLQCEPNLRCYNSTCQGLLPNGFEGCVNDFDCMTNAGCNITTHGGIGVCVPYFSIPTGANTGGDCSANPDFSMLCTSGWCQKSSWISRSGTCISAPMSVVGTPVRCVQASDCVGASASATFIGSCTCGYNAGGNAYCSPFPGDVAGLSVMHKISALANSGSLAYCNTARRFTEGCWTTLNSTFVSDLEASIYYYNNYALLQGNDDCVKAIFLNDYYKIPPVTAIAGWISVALISVWA